ncbi:hypothetical protein ACP275_07G056600 [Erythranthe tilingii]
MVSTSTRSVAAPLLYLNLIMYFIVLGFSSWCLNRYINGQTAHPSMGGNGATGHFLTFSILAAVLGIVNDSLAAACSSAIVAWAVTALAFGLACKEINVGGWRGWRLRMVEAFVIILAFTQLIYVLMLHAGLVNRAYGPGYRDSDYGFGGPGTQPVSKGGATAGGVSV